MQPNLGILILQIKQNVDISKEMEYIIAKNTIFL